MIDPAQLAAAGGAAFAAGAVNAVAGGGTLITFPTLVALGLSPVTASATSTVALCPGFLGAAISQRRDLAGQGRRCALLLPIGIVGALAGAELLLNTQDSSFDAAVPFLILLAALLIGAQAPIRAWLFGHERTRSREGWAALPVLFASIYGGYFGAGMSVMILAALGIVLNESMLRINALKQLLSLCVNVAAASIFLFSDRVEWPFVGVMAVGALVGGSLGGRVVSRIPTRALRWTIVVFGVALAIVYFVKR